MVKGGRDPDSCGSQLGQQTQEWWGQAPSMATRTLTRFSVASMAKGPRGGGSAWIAVKKAQMSSSLQEKELEKLDVYSACRAEESCKCNGWKNSNPSPEETSRR